MKDELRQVKKEFAEPRKTDIKEEITDIKIDSTEMIAKEEIECRLAGAKIETRYETKLEMVDAMLANDIPVDKIAVISGISQEEILKRRAQR